MHSRSRSKHVHSVATAPCTNQSCSAVLSSFYTIRELCTYETRLCVGAVPNGLHKAHTDKPKGVKYLKCHVVFYSAEANTATTTPSDRKAHREQFRSHSNASSQSGCAFKCRWRVFCRLSRSFSFRRFFSFPFFCLLFVLVDHNDHTPINWAQTLN